MAIMQSLRAESFNASLANALVVLAALFQNVCCLPASASRRGLLFLILLLPGVVLVPRHPSVVSWGSRLSQTVATPDMHPIEKLAANGQEQFSYLLTRQSNTLGKAVAEYVRRYRRNPPRNFDKWFKIAKREDYVLFDEFDTIMETLEPFWSLSAAELRSRVNAALEDPRIIRFNISNSMVMFDHEGWAPWMAEQVQSWLPPEWRLQLPDMTFAVNILDEPRVLAPFDILSRSLHPSETSDSEEAAHLREWSNRQHAQMDFLQVGRQRAWQEMASACSLDSPARNYHPLQGEDRGLEFIVNATNSLDVCMQPSLHKMHGFFSSPDSLDITHTLVPIFSQGKPSIFNDILFPSPYYAGRMDKEEYVEEEDPDWTLKSDTLYWSGATTGGYATMTNWKTLHRQRLILALKAQPSNLVTVLNETSPGQWDPRIFPSSDLQPLFNLKIVGTAQCDPEACEAERSAFNILPFNEGEENPNRDPLNLTYQTKYALDLDGNGFSGRYYRLLKSRSAVVKQTIFKEWHDGHLVPWVHYIPLSMDGTELPEIMRFLIQDRRGRKLGEKIARESRSWANITLRKIDLQLAFLRLLLEYGRLMSDERDTLYYEV
jgi:Glycosyl transferase family 90